MSNYDRQESEVQIYSMSSNTWNNKGVVPYRLEKWSSPGVLVNGRLHWVGQWSKYVGCLARNIVSYDLSDDSFHVIKNPGSASGSFGRLAMNFHLAALDGCLCAAVPVPPGQGALDIWIMKEYGVNESWVKEYSIGLYYPVSMISHEMERPSWRSVFPFKVVRILCVLKSGEVLLEYGGGGRLVSYDPHSGVFKAFQGMPRTYHTTVHVGSLKSAAFPF